MNTILILSAINIIVWLAIAGCAVLQGIDRRQPDDTRVTLDNDHRPTGARS